MIIKIKRKHIIIASAMILVLLGSYYYNNRIPDKIQAGQKMEVGDIVASAYKGDKCGVINAKGEWIIPPQFNEKVEFHKDYGIVKIKDKKGVIKLDGSLVIPFKYEQILFEDDQFICINKREITKISIGGMAEEHYVSPFDILQYCKGYIIVAQKNGSKKLIDTSGEISFQNDYDNLHFEDNAICIAESNNLFGFCILDDPQDIHLEYKSVESKSEGLVIVSDESGSYGINLVTKTETDKYKNIGRLIGGYMWFQIGDLCGLLDPKGNVIIKPEYKSVIVNALEDRIFIGLNKDDGAILVASDGSKHAIDGQIVQCVDDAMLVDNDGRYQLLNEYGEIFNVKGYVTDILSPIGRIGGKDNTCIVYRKDGKSVISKIDDNSFQDIPYDLLSKSLIGMSVVSLNDQSGVINNEGEIIIPLEFNSISSFVNPFEDGAENNGKTLE